MIAAQAPGRAVTGGLVEIREGSSAVDWAFYFVDFFRYASPVRAGPSPTLTVCNVAYSKARLAAIADTWKVYFHETAINDALRERFGELWLEPLSRVTMSRHVTLGDALYERYAFGRLGCTRLGFCTPASGSTTASSRQSFRCCSCLGAWRRKPCPRAASPCPSRARSCP